MHAIPRRGLSVLSLCLAVGCVAYTLATRPAQAVGWNTSSAAPATLGVVNLDELLKGLSETKDRTEQIQASKAARTAELEQVVKKLKDAQAELELTPKEDTKSLLSKRAQVFELETQAKAKRDALQTILNFENGDIIRGLYTKVTASCEKLAAKQGLDLVIVDDRAMRPLPESGSEQEMRAAIQSRQILFASKAVDVTGPLVTLMNNEYNAGGKK